MDLVLHDEPDKAVAERIKEVTARGLGQESRRKLIRKYCLTDWWFLVRYIFQYHFFCEDLHYNTLYRWKYENMEDDLVTCIPRGHVKTLSTAVDITQEILRNPDIAILGVSATDDLCKGLGKLVGDTLRHNERLVWAFNDILPQGNEKLRAWGAYGYQLPRAKPRLEKTLELASMRTTKTGKHPDLVFIDDITVAENNNENGWQAGADLINNLRRMCNPWGKFRWNATRWDDGDTVGMAIEGNILGKQGKFKSLVMSCYEDDDPTNDVIYKYKQRWNQRGKPNGEWSGYRKEEFERERKHPDPKVRRFFSCQLRNNPVPEEEQRLELKSLRFFGPEEGCETEKHPDVGRVISVGVETTGGGLVVYNLLEEQIQQQKLNIPLEEVKYPKERGVSKADRIHAALDPWIREGRLWVPKSEFPKDLSNTDCLGYELRRLGAGKNDDIADALHIIPKFLTSGLYPRRKGEPAHLYIGVDLAYTEAKASDYTVALAACVDHNHHLWVLGYSRFRIKQPTIIVHRLIDFYNHWNNRQTAQPFPSRKGSWASSYN